MANIGKNRPSREDHERYEEHPDLFMRDMVEWVKESCPKDFLLFLEAIGMQKINLAFKNDEFCVISGLKHGLRKEENLGGQIILAEEVRLMGLGFIPHIGFWDNLGHRCLFVPYMTKEQCQKLCQKYKLSHYIHGKGGLWCCYATATGLEVSRDIILRYIDFDRDFVVYYKLSRKKFSMLMELKQITEKKGRLSAEQRNRVAVVIRQVKDLERLEKEFVEKQL